MSIFPFIDPDALGPEESTELPLFKEYAYDYEKVYAQLTDSRQECV